MSRGWELGARVVVKLQFVCVKLVPVCGGVIFCWGKKIEQFVIWNMDYVGMSSGRLLKYCSCIFSESVLNYYVA